MAPRSSPDLFVAFLDGMQSPDALAELHDAARLAEGLWLIRSDRTLSQVYHALKRMTRPERLLVARVDGDPKFKGMAAGALKWLRAGPS
jgi:hypothetical protein